MSARRRLFRFPRRSAAEVAADLEEELAFHLDMVAEELTDAGWDEAAAREEALRRFGDLAATRKYCRALDVRKETRMRWTESLSEIGSDLHHALRQLRKEPAFTAMAVLTLALGIGATTGIFSIVHGVLLEPLPFRAPEHLVHPVPIARDGGDGAFSPLNFLDWRAQSRTVAAAAAIEHRTINLSGSAGEGGEPERLQAAAAGVELFQVLGVAPLLGRGFVAEEGRPGADRVAVLSEQLWRRRFGADPRVVGRQIVLDGEPHVIVGVMPHQARYPGWADVWVPLVFKPEVLAPQVRGAFWLDSVARLAPGATLPRAQAEAATIGRRLAAQYPEANAGRGLTLRPLAEEVVGEARTPLLVLLGAVGCVLLIACVNVANLLLVRAAARQGEIAVRAALGAGRARLVRQLLTESVALALLGGAAGTALAFWLTRALLALAPAGTPRLDEVGVSGPVLAFALAVTLVTGLLFGLAPALQSSRPDLNRTLKEGGRGSRGGASGRARAALVVAETALAVVLLAGAGLLIQSFDRLRRVDLGFRPQGVTTFTYVLPEAKYPDDARLRAFNSALLERVERLPGVESAGAIMGLPLGSLDIAFELSVDGRPAVPLSAQESVRTVVATPGYFRTMGIPLLKGRAFTPRDRDGAPQVALINAAAARRFFPGEEAVGRRVALGWNVKGQPRRLEIVGVVGDARQLTPQGEPQPELFLPAEQVPVPLMSVVVRSAADPAALAALLRGQVRALDPDLPVYDLRPLPEAVSASVSQPRFYMLLLGGFAATALLLAAVGIYGVISFAVGQRSQEIGIRMALGATRDRVLRGVVGQGLALAVAGAAAGLAGAVLATRGLVSLLYQVSATDPKVYAGVALVLVAVAAIAAYFPARRAAEIEPHLAIRGE